MKEIFQEYGGVLITVIAISMLILIVRGVIGSNGTDPNTIYGSFQQIITKFIAEAGKTAGTT